MCIRRGLVVLLVSVLNAGFLVAVPHDVFAQQCAPTRVINQWYCTTEVDLNTGNQVPVCKILNQPEAPCNQSTCSVREDVSQSSECYVSSGSCTTAAGSTKYCYILGDPPPPGSSNDCGPYPCAPPPAGGGGGGGGGCNPNAWGAWSGCNVSCGSGQQSRQNACGTYQFQSCCSECGPYTGSWGSCSGSPATKTRTIAYDCQASTSQSASCTGSIQARAVVVSAADTSCTAVRASTSGIGGAVHQFTAGSASQPAAQTQSGASYVTFSGVVGGTYTVSPTVPSTYVLTRACWIRTLNALTSGEGLSSSLSVPADSETLTWDLGYRLGVPWVQTGGGNVYAAGTLSSYIPSGTTPRAFSLDGAGGLPGVAIYGTSYDFDSDPTLTGGTFVSSYDWLVNETHSPVVNYYEYFRIKLGGPITPSTVAEMGSPQESMSKPPSRTTPYYVVGDMTTSGDWVVGEGETVIFIVTGNLTLGGKVNITGSGFVAFIARGNITVSSSVGGLYTSSTPVIEGIYVTSPTGTFQTGTSTVVGKERLVAQGIFVAGGFLLERDLDSVDANPTTSSELFLYNPRLLFTMPDSMRDVHIFWQEVAP